MIMTVLVVAQLAQPVLKPRDAQCPGDYRASGSFCVPMDEKRAPRAIPKPRDAQCPGNWRTSGDFCVEMSRPK